MIAGRLPVAGGGEGGRVPRSEWNVADGERPAVDFDSR